MTHSKIKTLLLTGVTITALSGAFMWHHGTAPSFAADEHGHDHAHGAEEEAHDTQQEEHGHGHEDEHGHGGEEHAEGVIALSAGQIKAANITVATTRPGKLANEVTVPGKITAAADRMAQIVPKVSGTVTEARKNLGDRVEKGEILALIESREMAEATADFLAARRAEELANTTFQREKSLWQKKITAEQDYLNARNIHQEAAIRLDLTRQKLQALGQDGDIDANANSRFHALKSPISGRVIGRELTLGEYVDSTHAAFTVADLGTVWVETAIAPANLPFVQEHQSASVTSGAHKATGKLIFISPAIDPETRAAKAIIELDNAGGTWRPGEFVNAAIATSAQEIGLSVPKDAVQILNGKPAVFVRTTDGFEKRDVTMGREDSQHIEILSGLSSGETIAVSNTFTLKAELGKAEAEHEH